MISLLDTLTSILSVTGAPDRYQPNITSITNVTLTIHTLLGWKV